MLCYKHKSTGFSLYLKYILSSITKAKLNIQSSLEHQTAQNKSREHLPLICQTNKFENKKVILLFHNA